MLPFMMVELCAYGLFSGLLCNIKLPAIMKIVAVQVAGRVIRAISILLAIYAFGNESVQVASV